MNVENWEERVRAAVQNGPAASLELMQPASCDAHQVDIDGASYSLRYKKTKRCIECKRLENQQRRKEAPEPVEDAMAPGWLTMQEFQAEHQISGQDVSRLLAKGIVLQHTQPGVGSYYRIAPTKEAVFRAERTEIPLMEADPDEQTLDVVDEIEAVDQEMAKMEPSKRAEYLREVIKRMTPGGRNFSFATSEAFQAWATPQLLFNILHAKFNFQLDLAASAEHEWTCTDPRSKHFQLTYRVKCNAKLPAWYGPGSSLAQDSFKAPWCVTAFLNPPYGRIGKIEDWLARALLESQRWRCTIVVLIPARVSEAWWWSHALRATEVWFVKGRVRFDAPFAASGAGFPSAVLVFNGAIKPPKRPKIVWWDIDADDDAKELRHRLAEAERAIENRARIRAQETARREAAESAAKQQKEQGQPSGAAPMAQA